MNNNHIEFKLIQRKTDMDDVMQECSAYLKTKQFMADRIYQQQEEIQILKQQIFSLSSTNSQLGRFIENFEKEIYLLKVKFSKKEKENSDKNEEENLNNDLFLNINNDKSNNIIQNYNIALANKEKNNLNSHSKNKKSKKINFNLEENNNNFNLSDDDHLIKSEVLPTEEEENKEKSFSDFEQMNYQSIDNVPIIEQEIDVIKEKMEIILDKSYTNENINSDKDKINNSFTEKLKKKTNLLKHKFENLKISEKTEIEENFITNKKDCNFISNKNDLNKLNKNTCCLKNNNFSSSNNIRNNFNLSFHNYNFQIDNEKHIADKVQKLNNDIIEKTIENNKLRTDKYIIISELNEILTSLTRIDLNKLNEFYLKNISKNNISKDLMPTAKGIKYNILSCQNNLAKITKSDLMKNCELEKIFQRNLKEKFNNNHFNAKNQFSPIKSNSAYFKRYYNDENYNQLYSNYDCFKNNNYDDSFNMNIENENRNKNSKKNIINNFENNFNLDVNTLYNLFSKHETEFDALLEKKLMNLNKISYSKNTYNKNNNDEGFNANSTRNNESSKTCNPTHYSTKESYSP